MKKVIKRNLLVLFSVLLFISGLFAFISSANKSHVNSAFADEPLITNSSDFTIGGAAVRLKDPVGLRFRIKMTPTLYAKISETDKIGAFLFPEDFLPEKENIDYATDIDTKLDFDLTDKMYLEDDYYYGNCVIANINEGNFTRNFVTVGYIKHSNGQYEYSTYTQEDNTRSVAYVAERAYDYYSQPIEGYKTYREILANYMKDVVTVNTTFGGFGTEQSPYTIYTKAQLQYIANNLSSNDYFEGVYFKLCADLVGEKTVNFKIGNASAAFKGIFDGDGHTIDLNISGSAAATGLFAKNAGTIKNLITTGTVTNTSGANTSALCAVNNGVIENCVNYADVTSAGNNVGGIAGNSTTNTAVVRNCKNYGAIEGLDYVSGVVGLNNTYSQVINCITYSGATITINTTATQHLGKVYYHGTNGVETDISIDSDILNYYKSQSILAHDVVETNLASGSAINQTYSRTTLKNAFQKLVGNGAGPADLANTYIPAKITAGEFSFADNATEEAILSAHFYSFLKSETGVVINIEEMRVLLTRIYNALDIEPVEEPIEEPEEPEEPVVITISDNVLDYFSDEGVIATTADATALKTALSEGDSVPKQSEAKNTLVRAFRKVVGKSGASAAQLANTFIPASPFTFDDDATKDAELEAHICAFIRGESDVTLDEMKIVLNRVYDYLNPSAV